MPFNQQVLHFSMVALTYFWIFILGGSLASFLNVVAYRLPRGLNIHSPPSHCESCGKPIKLRDNVPVLGWLILRGKCRNCGVAISPQHVYIEALFGGLIVMLAVFEVFSGGANLPLWKQYLRTGVVWLVFDPKWELIGIYTYHVALCCLLMGAILIEVGGFRTPLRYYLTGLMIAIIPAMAWPWLRPVAFATGEGMNRIAWPWLAGLIDGAFGAGIGWALGVILALAQRDGDPWFRTWRRSAIVLSLVGAFLGWQAALVIAAASCIAMLLAMLAELLRLGIPKGLSSGVLAAACTFLFLLFWRPIVKFPYIPGLTVTMLNTFSFLAGIIALALLLRIFEALIRPVPHPNSEAQLHSPST